MKKNKDLINKLEKEVFGLRWNYLDVGEKLFELKRATKRVQTLVSKLKSKDDEESNEDKEMD